MKNSLPTNSTAQKRSTRILSAFAACAALVFIFAAAECKQTTTFIGAQDEICNDGIDNDQDGRIDCRDSECAVQCKLELTVRPTVTTSHDTQTVSGTHRNANRIVVDMQPNSAGGGDATLQSSEWTFKVSQLQIGDNTLTIVASDSLGATQSVKAVIKRTGE